MDLSECVQKKKVLNMCLCLQHNGTGVVYLGQTPPVSTGDLIVSEVSQQATSSVCHVWEENHKDPKDVCYLVI